MKYSYSKLKVFHKIGVHPSPVDLNDDESGGNSSLDSGQESSSNGSADFELAETENRLSEDVLLLEAPVLENQAAVNARLEVEAFENAEC